ncbi:hypothetical protein [Haloarcula nitratireducens]|uniref:DUF7847 domain-containing protein n=1 Tax=Haloarcula nitratireducens TaxID=2487749 RepID=A0AAW4PAV9_9EURY|nr:hypothetical protein [Halomicroarcula nitratireducens]MBX0295029.1 hypothetical protein [Halomicroarcula nitratireducens]
MSLSIGAALRNGFDDFASEKGALFTAVFVLLGIANAVFSQTFSVALYERLFDFIPTTPENQAQLEQARQAVVEQAPLSLGTSLAAALLGLFVLFLVAEVLRIVAIRAFGDDAGSPLPDDATRALGSTALTAILAAILTGIVVAIGTVLFVIPGIVAVVLFAFVRQEIALNDSGVIESIRNSVGLVTDDALAVTGLLVVLVLLGIVVGLPLTLVPVPLSPVVTLAVNTIIGQLVAVYGIAVLTDAYQQVTAETVTEDEFTV